MLDRVEEIDPALHGQFGGSVAPAHNILDSNVMDHPSTPQVHEHYVAGATFVLRICVHR